MKIYIPLIAIVTISLLFIPKTLAKESGSVEVSATVLESITVQSDGSNYTVSTNHQKGFTAIGKSLVIKTDQPTVEKIQTQEPLSITGNF